MRPYAIEFSGRAKRDLAKLARPVQKRLEKYIDALSKDPHPRGCRKVVHPTDLYRIRVGSYRVVYQVHDDVLVVLVIRIGHRREVYVDL